MAKRVKKESKVIELLPNSGFDTDPGVEEIEDDPRAGMTKEEMIAFEQQEQMDLERRMDRFMQGAGSAQPNTSGISDDEEEEIFTLNLEEGRIEQKLVDVVVPVEKFKEVIKEIAAAPVNPYTDLITNLFTKRALQSLYTKLRESRDAIAETQISAITRPQIDAINKLVEDLSNQMHELRSSYASFGTDVYYNKIPVWAERHVKNYIEDALNQLVTFVSEE